MQEQEALEELQALEEQEEQEERLFVLIVLQNVHCGPNMDCAQTKIPNPTCWLTAAHLAKVKIN